MALKVLLLRSKLDSLKAKLGELRKKDADFETREKELETAIGEMTEETSDEDRKVVEDRAAELENEKRDHDQECADLEKKISDIEGEIEDEEKEQTAAEPKPEDEDERAKEPGKEKRSNGGLNTMETKFFGMNMMERDGFFAREDVKAFLAETRSAISQKRALTNVGLTIPDVMLPLIRQRTEAASKLIGVVNVRDVAGTSRQNIMGVYPEGYWTEMTAALNEMSLGFTNVEMDGYKVGGYFAVANAILEDSDLNLASELITAIGMALGKALDKAIIYGKGVKMPLGFVTRLAQSTKPSDYSSTGRTWADLHAKNIMTITGKTGIDLFKEIVKSTKPLKNDYNMAGLTWMMSQNTHTDLIIQAMGTNQAAAVVSGMNGTMPVIGGQIIELNFIPDGDIAYGYMDLYALGRRKGVQIGQSEHVKFIEDQTVFKGTARYDGKPVIAEGFGLLNIAGTAPTTTNTFAGE